MNWYFSILPHTVLQFCSSSLDPELFQGGTNRDQSLCIIVCLLTESFVKVTRESDTTIVKVARVNVDPHALPTRPPRSFSELLQHTTAALRLQEARPTQ